MANEFDEFCERDTHGCDRCAGLASNSFTRTLGERSSAMTLEDALIERENAKLRALVVERSLGGISCDASQSMAWSAGEKLATLIAAKYEKKEIE